MDALSAVAGDPYGALVCAAAALLLINLACDLLLGGLLSYGGLPAVALGMLIGGCAGLVSRSFGMTGVTATAVSAACGVAMGVLAICWMRWMSHNAELARREARPSELIGDAADVIWWRGGHGEVGVRRGGDAALRLPADGSREFSAGDDVTVVAVDAGDDGIVRSVTVVARSDSTWRGQG